VLKDTWIILPFIFRSPATTPAEGTYDPFPGSGVCSLCVKSVSRAALPEHGLPVCMEPTDILVYCMYGTNRYPGLLSVWKQQISWFTVCMETTDILVYCLYGTNRYPGLLSVWKQQI
jgi:hypothetical protein